MRPPCRRKNGAPIVLQRTPSRDKHAQIQGPPLQVIVKTLAPVEAKEVQIRNQSPYKSTQPILSQTLVQQLQSVTQPIQSTKLLQSPLPVQPTSQITQQVPASVQIAQPVDS